MEKTCVQCGETKPLDAFHKHPNTRDGRREKCKVCIRAYVKQWRLDNIEVVKAKAKAKRETPEYRALKAERNRLSAANLRKRLGDDEYRARLRRKQMAARLLATHGLTVAALERMLESQGHACAICQGPITMTGNRNVDHDHATGRVRGLLCRNCNTALGNFKENPEIIEAAIRYLANGRGVPCDICGTDLSESKHYMRHIDHCHETGRVRGLLCERCNRGLGQFEDDPERMRRAMDYLARSTAY